MSESFDDASYDHLVTEGITALKGGYRDQARRLLERATLSHRPDARPWLALVELAADPAEKRRLLECAVAADPFNPAARRLMAELSDQFDHARVLQPGEGVQPAASPEPEEAHSEETTCPKCGGRLHFNPLAAELVCEYCGRTEVVEIQPAADEGEQVLDYALPTSRAHRWAEAQEQLQCGKCGAVSLLAAGQKSSRCAYCGSNQLVSSTGSIELIDPQAIGLMRIDANQATRAVKKWFGKGTFIPDDLQKAASKLHLRPAYYPFWTFDGILEVNWSCQVNQGSSRAPHWVSRSGVEMEIFDDVLAPGLKSLPAGRAAAVEPFVLKEVVEFDPKLLAGWIALGYDCPLADASLNARERIMKRLQSELDSRVEPGEEKRNLSTGAGKWAALSYKHVLLPLWVGSYTYQGKSYDLLVNGQTGKIAGEKPRDRLKVWLLVICGLLLLLMFAMLAYMYLSPK